MKTRLFVVEEEAPVALEISSRLQKLGYEVCGMAATAEDALEKIPNLRPHLIFMDIRMPAPKRGLSPSPPMPLKRGGARSWGRVR